MTDAGRVDADVGHVVLFGQFFDRVSLGAEVHPAPLVTLKNAELTTRHGWRCHHHASGAVAVLRTFCRVITDPHFAPAKRAQSQCMKVGPDFPTVHHARLQLAEREHGREIVHKLAHQQVLVFVRAVLHAQLVKVEQVTAAAHRIFHGDYLAVLPVCAQQAGGQIAVGQVDVHLVGLVAPTVEQRTGPERISTVGQAGWRGKIGLSPFFVNSHTGSHFAQLLEFRYPEIFIQIQVAVITLGRAGIGAEEVKRGSVRKHHRIAFQLHLDFFGEVYDVLLKDVSLCLTGRKENLVTSGKQGVNQGFTGKVKGRTDLA